MGAERSLARVDATLGKNTRLIDRWFWRWSWMERAAAYDAEMDRVRALHEDARALHIQLRRKSLIRARLARSPVSRMMRRYLQSVRADDQQCDIGQTEEFEAITDSPWASATCIDDGQTNHGLGVKESDEYEEEAEYRLVWPYLDPPDPTDEEDDTGPAENAREELIP
jgi:hypothetical protein